MQTLVQDLLTFSRVGRQDTDLQSTDCNAVMAVAKKNLQAAISESGAQIHCDPLPVICADGSQLQQVFQNLIGNAIKFRGPEPPVIRVIPCEKRILPTIFTSHATEKKHWVFSSAMERMPTAPLVILRGWYCWI